MENRIIVDLRDSYGLACHEITPVTGGWLNLKWKVGTDAGDVLVKQFSNRRFTSDQLEAIEAALQRQMLVEADGVRCPPIRPHRGRAIRLLNAETAYMVMAFCPGRQAYPHTVTAAQMQSLGDACGSMHRAFSRLPALSVKGFPLDDVRTFDSLRQNYHARVQAASPDDPAPYREALGKLAPILRQLTPAFFARIPRGIAHEDFSADNILFDGDCVSAIVDFDRNQYSYLWHDIGRALLSLAWDGERMDSIKIAAFAEGYARHVPLKLADIADVLRLSWCIEILWWIQPEFFRDNHQKVIRFRDEMLWLTQCWLDLDAIVCR